MSVYIGLLRDPDTKLLPRSLTLDPKRENSFSVFLVIKVYTKDGYSHRGFGD